MSAVRLTPVGVPDPDRKHILTIALEDYFHAPAFRGFIDQKQWGRFESRYENSCLSALDRLDRAGSSATFFVNSWVARDRPDLLREVVRRGHEIAVSGDGVPSFRGLTRTELREHVRNSRATVEESCGHRVLGYRRSDVWLNSKDLWALEVLAEEGFLYDSSLSPTLWAFQKEPWRRFIHKEQFGTQSIQEVPLSSQKVFTMMMPFAGGNYFRQYPKRLIDWSIRNWSQNEDHPMVLYFRLWDLDPSHPKIETSSIVRNFRHYRNGAGMLQTLAELFERYRFESIASHLNCVQELVASPAVQARKIYVATSCVPERRSVSVIVPCYNEQTSVYYLDKCLAELALELVDSYELQYILVDDGSTDLTWDRLREQFGGRPDVLLLRHSQNRGVAAAISTGMEESHDIACSVDCDCSYDPRELKAMLALLQDGVDMVTASPYHPQGKVSNVPSWRLGLSRGASMLYRGVTGSNLHTFTACFRVYRRSAAMATPLELSGFLGVAELVAKFVLTGRRVIEHPAKLDVRLFGYSKMKIVRTVAGHFKLLASLAWSRITGRYSNNARLQQQQTVDDIANSIRRHP